MGYRTRQVTLWVGPKDGPAAGAAVALASGRVCGHCRPRGQGLSGLKWMIPARVSIKAKVRFNLEGLVEHLTSL